MLGESYQLIVLEGIPWKAVGRRQLILELVGKELGVGAIGEIREGHQSPSLLKQLSFE